MTDRLLRLRDVMHLTGLGRSTIYRKIKEATFPVRELLRFSPALGVAALGV